MPAKTCTESCSNVCSRIIYLKARLSMSTIRGLIGVLVTSTMLAVANNASAACPESLDHHLRPLTGKQPVHLCEVMRGKVVLVVNTRGILLLQRRE